MDRQDRQVQGRCPGCGLAVARPNAERFDAMGAIGGIPPAAASVLGSVGSSSATSMAGRVVSVSVCAVLCPEAARLPPRLPQALYEYVQFPYYSSVIYPIFRRHCQNRSWVRFWL